MRPRIKDREGRPSRPGRGPTGRSHEVRLLPAAILLLALQAIGAARASAQEQTEPFSATRAQDLRPSLSMVAGKILILTPEALYRFQPESEAWTVTPSSAGLARPPLASLTYTGDRVWTTGQGASFSDPRFDDWQAYRPGEGYPGRRILRIEADADYAYAATDSGAARFDAYTLEWEAIRDAADRSLPAAEDVTVGEDRVWFAVDGGVAEYRKESESLRLDTDLGGILSPHVLALRQTTRYVWAVTDAGLARYDKTLQSWTAFRAKVDVPDARLHQLTMDGEDLWLGTDAGLWRYRGDVGIWRKDESADAMPGARVLAFAIEPTRTWVVSERAFALYEKETARWIDFTSDVPMQPADALQIGWMGGTLVLLGSDRIVCGLARGETSPSLFTYRIQAILGTGPGAASPERWRIGLGPDGLGATDASGRALRLKGGATIYVEKEEGADEGRSPLADLAAEARYDLTLTGRLGNERTLNGFYDTTDPENHAYQITYHGNREDHLRTISAGEIEQEIYNTNLTPGTGLEGGSFRVEAGARSEETRRRRLTADGWIGRRRTAPGRDVFHGRNRRIDGTLRDIDYAARAVFPVPEGWTEDDLRRAVYYFDDAESGTNDANTEHRVIAGREGAFDRLAPNRQYMIGSSGATLLLLFPVVEGQALLGVREGDAGSPQGEKDLTELWLRNHYAIATEPVPGSLEVTVVDSTGASVGPTGTPYLREFGLDGDGDGQIDPARFSPISGMLDFPTLLPFPDEVYEEGKSLYRIQYGYETRLNTFRLSHRNLISGSEKIWIDRALMRPNVDYSLIPSSGLVVFYEQVAIDEDAVIEIEYEFEVEEDAGGSASEASDDLVASGQIGLAPDDHLFLGASGTRWGEDGAEVVTADLNGRLEWKSQQSFLRVVPELALSRSPSSGTPASSGDSRREGGGSTTASASAIGLQGRYHALDLSASHRSLGDRFASFEDRRTLAGILREESYAHGRLDITKQLQTEVEWDRSLAREKADSSGSSSGPGLGETSSLIGTVRLLRSSLPNLELRRGRIILDSPGERQEKWITRVDLEIDLLEAGVSSLGLQRLWLRSFYQRSDRRFDRGEAADDTTGARSADRPGRAPHAGAASLQQSDQKRSTDHTFARLNGSVGVPLAWDLAFEDQWTRRTDKGSAESIRRLQRADATLQSQPHSSLDAFARWGSNRDLNWGPKGSGGGFTVDRLGLATVHLYPGRISDRLSPVSFRFDVSRADTEEGEPGVPLPSAGSLLNGASDPSIRSRSRDGIAEGRLQILSWARLVERWETGTRRTMREDLETRDRDRRLESRLELKPAAGLLTLRAIGSRSEDQGAPDEARRRLAGEWSQTWGRGLLTYASIEGERLEREDRSVGDLSHRVASQARVTWRRSRWQIDATLGAGLAWVRTKDQSVGAPEGWQHAKQQSLTASISLQPWKLITIKANYDAARTKSDAAAGDAALARPAWGQDTDRFVYDGQTAGRWKTQQELRVRLLFRA